MPSSHDGVLLLSARPEAHASLIGAMSRHGVNVRVARRPVRALEMLLDSPSLVLVDLAHRALDDAVVSALNERASTVVFVLTEGHSAPALDGLSDLEVDGFCRPDSPQPVFHALNGRVSSNPSHVR